MSSTGLDQKQSKGVSKLAVKDREANSRTSKGQEVNSRASKDQAKISKVKRVDQPEALIEVTALKIREMERARIQKSLNPKAKSTMTLQRVSQILN
ncbi:hypothetical protein ACEPPN_000278 [Leptodophora sp. 'Broadleaf-Isolate-01']